MSEKSGFELPKLDIVLWGRRVGLGVLALLFCLIVMVYLLYYANAHHELEYFEDYGSGAEAVLDMMDELLIADSELGVALTIWTLVGVLSLTTLFAVSPLLAIRLSMSVDRQAMQFVRRDLAKLVPLAAVLFVILSSGGLWSTTCDDDVDAGVADEEEIEYLLCDDSYVSSMWNAESVSLSIGLTLLAAATSFLISVLMLVFANHASALLKAGDREARDSTTIAPDIHEVPGFIALILLQVAFIGIVAFSAAPIVLVFVLWTLPVAAIWAICRMRLGVVAKP